MTIQSLTPKQAEIYHFILQHIEEHIFPPTVREIADHFGLRSTNGVAQHLNALIRKGYLTKDGSKSRALKPMIAAESVLVRSGSAARRRTPTAAANMPMPRVSKSAPAPITLVDTDEIVPPVRRELSPLTDDGRHREIPVLGQIAAGLPIEAYEEYDERLSMDASLFVRGFDDVFALRVRGTSMIGDGIMPGDIVFVQPRETAQNGDLIAAVHEGQATVKRYERIDDAIRLLPSNPEMQPIVIDAQDSDGFRILGAIRGVLRQYP